MEKPRRISVARLLVPHWKTLSVGFLASIVCSAMDLLQPWPLKLVIDNVIGSKKVPALLLSVLPNIAGDRTALLNATALSLIAIALIGAIGSYIQNMTMTGVGQWVMHDLRTTLYHHIQRL